MKKAQTASAAATLVALIAGMIILYVLFLPADVRDSLLGDGDYVGLGGSSGTTSTSGDMIYNETVLEETPGRIDYLRFSSYEHPLSTVSLYTSTSASTLLSEESLYVKNGIFDKLSRNITFYIDDLDNTDNILLSFNINKGQGRLRIYMNNEIIYDGTPSGLMDPIDLSKRDIKVENKITFEVGEVGWKFWTTNEYELENIMVTADITDVSEQLSRNTFTVTDTEKFNLERSYIKFFPDCNPRTAGSLKVYINNEMIFSSIPDCSQINMVEFSPSTITAGDNTVIFKAEKGAYQIYQIMVHTELKSQTYPVYYFDLPDTLFFMSEEYKHERFLTERKCGDVDDHCPVGCDEDLDIDCCFEGRGNYWCDIEPDDEDDRCASITNEEKCERCSSGYEDENGYAPEECEEECGDDHDNSCPTDCSKYYDKDCCFDEDENNFWCDEVPVYGLENVCESALNPEECDDCPTEYSSNSRSYSDECPSESEDIYDEVMEVKPAYEIVLTLEFLDDSTKKAAHVYVNGHKLYIDTYGEDYVREITDYVEDGSNAIKIEPDQTTLDVIKMTVEIK